MLVIAISFLSIPDGSSMSALLPNKIVICQNLSAIVADIACLCEADWNFILLLFSTMFC